MEGIGLSSRMIKLLLNKKTILLFRIILGLTFIYASLDKIVNPSDFSNLIDNFHISPVSLSNLVALFLPWIELICGLCLISGYMLRGSNILVFAMLLFFILILSQAVFRGIDTHCGCFKVAEVLEPSDFKKNLIKRIVEDIVLLSMSFVVLLKSFKLHIYNKEE